MSFPVTTTGLPIFLPSLFPEGLFIYVAGCSDDTTAGRGQGQPFLLQSNAADGPGVKTLTLQFADWVYFSGGGITWTGAQPGDWCSLRISANATQVAANAAGTGTADVAPGGYVLPNLTRTGQYDVTHAVPIHAVDDSNAPLGQWSWTAPGTGTGDVVPGIVQPNGRTLGDYIMLTKAMPLAQFIARFPLNGNGDWNLSMPFIKPARILPHWQVEVLLNNQTGHDGLSLSWRIVMARVQTI